MLNVNQTDQHTSGHSFDTITSSRSAGHLEPQDHSSPLKKQSNPIFEKKNFSGDKVRTPMSLGNNSFVNTQTHFSPVKISALSNSFTATPNITHSPPPQQVLVGNNDSRSTNICINLIHAEDADVEEFKETGHAATRIELRGGNTPIKSPKKKSMIGITEMQSPLKVFKTNDVKSDSESNQTTSSISSLGDIDESILEQVEGMEGNIDRISNMTLIHNFNVRFEENRYRADSIRRKVKKEINKAALSNPVILDHLINFLDCGDLINFSQISHALRTDTKFKVKVQQRLRKLILKGMDNQEQYSFWNAYIKFKNLKRDHATAFTQNFVRKCSYIKDIKKDLDRTLPEYDKYSTEEGKNALLKVLVAVSNSVKDVGYIQGLNSIAGVFLFYMKEEQAFWSTIYLLEKLKVKELLKENFQTIHLLNYQFSMFFENYLPEVVKHLNFQVVSLEYITTPWFITLFSYFLPLPKVLKLWNFFFLKGIAFLIQFGLAVFSHYQNAILELEPDEVPVFLKNELRDLKDDDDILFEKAMQFKVTKRLMQELSVFYGQGKPKVKLYKDDINRSRWQLTPLSFASEPNINLKTIERYEMNRFESKTPMANSRFMAPTANDPVAKESPFRFQKLFSAITEGIPGTLKNMFTRNKTSKNEHDDSHDLSHSHSHEPHIKAEINQAVSPPNQNNASVMEREGDSDGVVYLLERSPENIRTHDIIPDDYAETYQENYTISDKGMLCTETDVHNLMGATRTEPNESTKTTHHFYSEARNVAKTSRTNLSFEGKNSPGQIQIHKFSEVTRGINRIDQDLDQGFLVSLSLPKIDSISSADERIGSKDLMPTSQKENNDLKDPSVGNKKLNSRPLAL